MHVMILGRRPLTALALLCAATAAHAGRPMTTDDAAITTEGQCSLQSWWQRQAGAAEKWLLPACTPWRRTEFTVGPTFGADASGRSSTAYTAQAKVLVLPEHSDGWGLALAFATSFDAEHLGDLRLSSRWLNAITSYTSTDALYRIHINVGVLRDVPARHSITTWAIAYEFSPMARFGYFAEGFRTGAGPVILQVGCRYDVSEHFSLNATLGAPWHQSPRGPLASIGINVQ